MKTDGVNGEERPVALLSDFGLQDWYVAAMKGEILRRAPGTPIIDISHGVAPQQIAEAAFQLECALDSMPEGTVFCCVVDPGVGTSRRAICGHVGKWFFSGPDNGIVTPLAERSGGDMRFFSILGEQWRNPAVSSTFHGRDLFAPAAARLAQGWDPNQAGPEAPAPLLIFGMQPEERGDILMARVMQIDHFGNLVTNLRRDQYRERMTARGFVLRAGRLQVKNLESTFGSVGVNDPVAYWGSAGTLEIGVNHGSAAQRSQLPIGGTVEIVWK